MKALKFFAAALLGVCSAFAVEWSAYTDTYGARYLNAGIITFGDKWNLKTGFTYDAEDDKAGVNARAGFSDGFEFAGLNARFGVAAGVLTAGDTKWTAEAGFSLTRYGVMSFDLGLSVVDGNRLYPRIGLTIGK